MSHIPISGVHNPSPYLRRYRLPIINSNATVAAYEELLSPIDNCAKLAFISSLNFQNKKFYISKPNKFRNIGTTDDNSMELDGDKANSARIPAVTSNDTSSTDRSDRRTDAAIDFQFRFVATELEKKCHEYDRIADIVIDSNDRGRRKND